MKFVKKPQQKDKAEETSLEKKKKHTSKTQIFLIVICILFFILILIAGYFFYQYQKLKAQIGNTTQLNQSQTKELLSAIGKLILLPKDTPIIYTVTAVERLKTQPFFQNAENGDRLLLYPKEQEAFLYRPNQNMLINVGPIATAPQQQQSLQPAVTQKLLIGLLNGTQVGGVTTKVATILQQMNPQPTIVFRKPANKTNYQDTTVVIVNKQVTQIAQTLASLLHAPIAALPTGETLPTGVDVLIIVGADKE